MYLERLSDSNRHLFDRAFALYESAFPREERRDLTEQTRVLNKEAYHVDFILNNGEFQGIMLYWETEDFIYLEHFTTLPEVRGNGIGSAALELLKAKGKTVLLEIEPPTDELTRRRFAFYQRNGFQMTPHYHIQAKYHLGDEDLQLSILSYPTIITEQQYMLFQDYMTKEIGIYPHFNKEITVRPMMDGDDRDQITKLIYLSDSYIYPFWFDSLEDAQKVLGEMISLPTLYHRDNIRVAVTESGEIAGAIVAKPFPIEEDEAHLYEAFERAGIPSDERTHRIYLDYYDKMKGNQQGLYLANLAVDPRFQKQGIATTLLADLLKQHPLCHLECVKANIGAWRIYQRLGFTIMEEYPGVLDVPCYRMIYNKG